MEWIDHITNVIVAVGVLYGGWQSWRNGHEIRKVKHATDGLMDARIVSERSEATLQERAANVASAAASAEERSST